MKRNARDQDRAIFSGFLAAARGAAFQTRGHAFTVD